MKKLDKIILALFSVLIFLESILLICIVVGWIKFDTFTTFFNMALMSEKASKGILIISIICLICAVKCIFFESSNKEKKKTGVLMQNDNGKLLISKSTIENIVVNVTNGFESAQNVDVDIDLDNYNNLIVNVNMDVSQNVVIKELTLNMQNKIKEAIKKTSDLEVKEVNVKIKSIFVEDNKE